MCLNPITIPNKVANFHPHYDRLYNTVPCGHCSECLKQKRDDWYVRSYYEWVDCTNKGGFAYFITLTYSQDWIPQLCIENNSCYCFDKTDIQKYLDALRKVIKRKYNTDMPFRYLITSEYGGKTHRPHYHLLIFFQKGFNENWLRYQIRRLWKYGFIKYGKENRGKITDYRGVRYVVKYITKDADFLPVSKHLKDVLPLETYKYYYCKCAPFHLQSNGLGACCNKYVTKNLLEQGTIPCPTKNGMKLFHMPQYLTRKYYYEYNKELQGYYPTYEGAAVLSARASKITEKLNKRYTDFFTNSNSYINNESLAYLAKNTSLPTDVEKIKSIFDYAQNNFHDFIYYIQYERFYMYVIDGFPEPFQNNPRPSYYSIYQRKYLQSKNGLNEFYYSDSRFSSQSDIPTVRKEAEQYLHNDLYENQNFELCVQLTEALQKSVNILNEEQAIQEQKTESQIKKLKSLYEYK